MATASFASPPAQTRQATAVRLHISSEVSGEWPRSVGSHCGPLAEQCIVKFALCVLYGALSVCVAAAFVFGRNEIRESDFFRV